MMANQNTDSGRFGGKLVEKAMQKRKQTGSSSLSHGTRGATGKMATAQTCTEAKLVRGRRRRFVPAVARWVLLQQGGHDPLDPYNGVYDRSVCRILV